MRSLGISAILRCKNEEEYIAACILSAYRVFDEFIVVLNNSTDNTRTILEDLSKTYSKIQIHDYNQECSPAGVGYLEKVKKNPTTSLATYYNWSFGLSRFSHVCKWDGDMIALPALGQVRSLLPLHDVILFDGFDAVGQHTTELEARIFKYDTAQAKYIDWDLYEVLQHSYAKSYTINDKCYLHMKLVKKEWLHKPWSNPNDFATNAYPTPNQHANSTQSLRSRAKSIAKRALKSIRGRET